MGEADTQTEGQIEEKCRQVLNEERDKHKIDANKDFAFI